MFVLGWIRRVAVLVCLMALPACAQSGVAHPVVDPHRVDGMGVGQPIDLTSRWLAKQGDDARWADPNFDDSAWMVVEEHRPPASYGLKNVDAIWYRTHVKMAPGQKNLALLVRRFFGSYVVYVNGVPVGSSGPHPPGGEANVYTDVRFPVPDAAVASGDVTIAIHGTIGRISERGVLPSGFTHSTYVLLGPAKMLEELTLEHHFRTYAVWAENVLLEFLIPLLALALALSLPGEREYLALVIYGAAQTAGDALGWWQTIHNVPPTDAQDLLFDGLSVVAGLALLEFVRLVLGLRRGRWFVAYEWLLVVAIVPLNMWIQHVYLVSGTGVTSGLNVGINVLAQLILLPFTVGLPLLALGTWWRRRSADALLLFVPLAIQAAVQYWNFALFMLNRLHLSELASLPPVPISWLTLTWGDVSSILFSVAILLFVVLRTLRIARSRAAMASDLEAVQGVQEILLARASHPTPGFVVESVYHPASEVGGDFFLVSPGPDGSLTAIVGDVSGKGLVAAMRVSMILGVLRREEQREPEEVLQNLNDALVVQGEMGFTTACCVRLERDGRYTVANAGHISPYVGGVEVVTPSSLPLGLVADAEYEQVSGVLPTGTAMVLMSDGVVEARSAKGELYGFERLGGLTKMKASDIADVAKRFGQEDDITVLTVACG